jgi:hypothetical protein
MCRLSLPFFRSVARTMSEKEVLVAIAQRIIIKFLVKENVGPTEIWTRLYSQYVELTLSKTQVKVWHKKFREGREAIENTSHWRRPRTSTNSSNVAAVRKLIEDDRRLTITQISQELQISCGSMQSIIKNELQYRKITARWVPKLLSGEQKNYCPMGTKAVER